MLQFSISPQYQLDSTSHPISPSFRSAGSLFPDVGSLPAGIRGFAGNRGFAGIRGFAGNRGFATPVYTSHAIFLHSTCHILSARRNAKDRMQSGLAAECPNDQSGEMTECPNDQEPKFSGVFA